MYHITSDCNRCCNNFIENEKQNRKPRYLNKDVVLLRKINNKLHFQDIGFTRNAKLNVKNIIDFAYKKFETNKRVNPFILRKFS